MNTRIGKTATLMASAIIALSVFAMPSMAIADDLTAGQLQTQSAQSQDMYRLYNPNSGEHFYTASVEERDYLDRIGWNYEGLGWKAPTSSNQPVYRLYNPNAGDHHYTLSASERDWLDGIGWNYEGVGWYSADSSGTPLYRQYNPNATTGTHNYTTSKAENDFLASIGWHAEGIGWYGLSGSANGNAAPVPQLMPQPAPAAAPTDKKKIPSSATVKLLHDGKSVDGNVAMWLITLNDGSTITETFRKSDNACIERTLCAPSIGVGKQVIIKSKYGWDESSVYAKEHPEWAKRTGYGWWL